MVVKAYTLDCNLIHDEFDRVILPTLSGYITVLDNHIPIVGIIGKGKVRLIRMEEQKSVEIDVDGTGYFEFDNNEMLIILRQYSLEHK